MVSIFTLLRFLLAVLFATTSSSLPILGDLADVAGGGATGSVFGFLILLVFYWFIVSKAFEFLAFAFGGGVGRYSTTKLYRRLQWLTFALFMTLPVLVGVTLLVSATPVGEHSETHLLAVAQEEGARRRDALARQRNQLATAIAERDEAIALEETRQRVAYNTAVREREDRIEAVRKALTEGIEAEIAVLPEMREIAQIEEFLAQVLDPIVDKYASSDYDDEGFRREFHAYLAGVLRRFRIGFTREEKDEFLSSGADAGIALVEAQMSESCQHHYEAQSFATAEIAGWADGRLCFLSFVIMNYAANPVPTANNTPLSTPIVADFARDYQVFAPAMLRSVLAPM